MIAIVIVAFIDSFSSAISNALPVLGPILNSLNNLILEIIELALILGLYKINKKWKRKINSWEKLYIM